MKNRELWLWGGGVQCHSMVRSKTAAANPPPAPPPLRTNVSRHHDVRVVGGRQEHKEVVKGTNKGRKVAEFSSGSAGKVSTG